VSFVFLSKFQKLYFRNCFPGGGAGLRSSLRAHPWCGSVWFVAGTDGGHVASALLPGTRCSYRDRFRPVSNARRLAGSLLWLFKFPVAKLKV